MSPILRITIAVFLARIRDQIDAQEFPWRARSLRNILVAPNAAHQSDGSMRSL